MAGTDAALPPLPVTLPPRRTKSVPSHVESPSPPVTPRAKPIPEAAPVHCAQCGSAAQIPCIVPRSPVVSVGGASIQANLQPTRTIFGASSQLHFRGTDLFLCDSPSTVNVARSPSQRTAKGADLPTSELLKPSYATGNEHITGRTFPQLTHRFSGSSSSDRSRVCSHSSPNLELSAEEAADVRKWDISVKGSSVAKRLLERVKSPTFASLAKVEGAKKGAKSSSKPSTPTALKAKAGTPGVLRNSVAEAATCLPTQNSVSTIGWSMRQIQPGKFGSKSDDVESAQQEADAGRKQVRLSRFRQSPSRMLSASAALFSSWNSPERPSTPEKDPAVLEEAGGVPMDPWAPGQFAEVFVGEDRAQVVMCSASSSSLTFSAIYDGFMDCAAVDFLMAHMFPRAVDELETLGLPGGAPCEHQDESDPVHTRVLSALSRTYEKVQSLYEEMAHVLHEEHPEMAVAGSCVALAVVWGPHLYVLNIGDSPVVLLQQNANTADDGDAEKQRCSCHEHDNVEAMEGSGEGCAQLEHVGCAHGSGLHGSYQQHEAQAEVGLKAKRSGSPREDQVDWFRAIQLTVDHNTTNEEEVYRVQKEHQDDPKAVDRSRLKSKLKVTRAFGGLFMKEAAMNRLLFGSFKINYVGAKPYLGSRPHTRHFPLARFKGYIVLSSDGLYQHLKPQDLELLAQQALGNKQGKSRQQKTESRSSSNTEGTRSGSSGCSSWCGGCDRDASDRSSSRDLGRNSNKEINTSSSAEREGYPVQVLARAFLDGALGLSAKVSCMDMETMLSTPLGESRRRLHDDITIVVLQVG